MSIAFYTHTILNKKTERNILHYCIFVGKEVEKCTFSAKGGEFFVKVEKIIIVGRGMQARVIYASRTHKTAKQDLFIQKRKKTLVYLCTEKLLLSC
jgi:hypothetical protein